MVYLEHPIHELLDVSLSNIRDMIDVDTIVGNPIMGLENTLIIPISKVMMGFAAGGSEFHPKSEKMPFGGGTGGSVVITPVAFLVVQNNEIKLLNLDGKNQVLDNIIDKTSLLARDAIERIQNQIEP